MAKLQGRAADGRATATRSPANRAGRTTDAPATSPSWRACSRTRRRSPALLPLELNEAAQGRYEPLMALSKLLASTVGGQIMHGMQLSVICTEDAAELKADPADVQQPARRRMIESCCGACAVWPQGKRPADFRAPLTGTVPVLILSGEFDPVTPPRYGDEVLRSAAQRPPPGAARPGPQRAAGRLHAEAVRQLRRHAPTPRRSTPSCLDSCPTRRPSPASTAGSREHASDSAFMHRNVTTTLHKTFTSQDRPVQGRQGVSFTRRATARSPACSAPTAPARPPPCACSTR